MNGLFTVSISSIETGEDVLKIEDAQLDENTLVELMAAASQGKGLVIPRENSVTVTTPSVTSYPLIVTISETAETQPE
jgi:hypothetical protein